MKAVTLILREIIFHKVNFALSLLAVVVAVALFVAFVTSGDAYRKETRRIQLGMGQNLRIIPKETPMDEMTERRVGKKIPQPYVGLVEDPGVK